MEITRKSGVKGIKIVEHNKRLLYSIIILAVILAVIVFYLTCLKTKEKINNQIANPASVYCIENNGTLEMLEEENGTYGLCVFKDNSSCEEWAYFRGECSNGENIEKECALDADCVPASCCHPTSCTSKENAPNCTGMFCTQECAPSTLDCGQGKCECLNNKCTAIIK